MWRASSDSVIFPIPGDEARNALFDAGGRPEAQIALYCRDVGKGIAHVSWLHRQASLLGLTSARRLYHPDQTGEFLALVVAYNIQSVRRTAGVGLRGSMSGRGRWAERCAGKECGSTMRCS